LETWETTSVASTAKNSPSRSSYAAYDSSQRRFDPSQINKTPALPASVLFRIYLLRIYLRLYFAGDSLLDAGPVGPVVVLGIVLGAPFAPPLSFIPEPPPDDMPLVPVFFMAFELVFVIAGLFMSCWPAGPVVCA
jgi:hypothetical protein